MMMRLDGQFLYEQHPDMLSYDEENDTPSVLSSHW
jgi:hypothetical protein